MLAAGRPPRHGGAMTEPKPLLSRNLAGVLSLCLGVMIFSLQDAILKGLSGSHAVTLAIVLRSLVPSIPSPGLLIACLATTPMAKAYSTICNSVMRGSSDE